MAEILESGRIAFLYRPRVDHPLVLGFEDVQGVSMLLRPESGGQRRLVLGRKRLPVVRGRPQRFWASVDRVGSSDERWDVAPYSYETQRHGERFQGPARLAAEGRYEILRRPDRSELSYHIALPHQPGEVQCALGIGHEGHFIAAVMNPWNKRPGRHHHRLAKYPQALQEKFRGLKYAPLEPAFLDHLHAEVVLIAGRTQPAPPLERYPNVTRAEEALRSVGLPPTPAFLRPLLQGTWA